MTNVDLVAAVSEGHIGRQNLIKLEIAEAIAEAQGGPETDIGSRS